MTQFLLADAVEPRQMPMLWRGMIPANTLTTIAGAPGVGKSTLSAFIAAELSRQGVRGIISEAEDEPESVTRPRLEAAGADLSKVAIVPDAPVLPRDFDGVAAMIEEFDARYLILSPVAAHFSPERRVHDRPTLRRLIALARRLECTMIAMHHQVQTQTGDPLTKIGGPASGLAGTSRAAYLYGFDPDDEDRRALACAKINGVEAPAALIFEHEVVEYESLSGEAIEAGVLRVVGESNASAAQTMRRGKKRRDRDAEAVEWLTRYLAAGDDCTRRASDVREWASRDGIPWQTVLRARVTIKATRSRASRAQGGGWGADGFWLWRLPDDHPMRLSADAEVVPS